jgi:hypothetical protein
MRMAIPRRKSISQNLSDGGLFTDGRRTVILYKSGVKKKRKSSGE